MKITQLELLMVKPRWMFLKMHTDTGLIGYGEPIVEGHTHAVAATIKAFENYLIGQDPRRIEHHWQALYRGGFYRGGPVLTSAISGIEQAMWDILGKSLGVPVYQLLGGAVRDRFRIYSHLGGATAEELVANARQKLAGGFTTLKFSFDAPIRFMEPQAFIENCVHMFKSLREAVGKEVDIAIDFHGRFSPALAKRLIQALEPYYPLFIEEPCLPENVDTMVEIARSTTIPIATGERLFTKWGFRQVLEKQAVAIVQPDLCHAGGILEGKKIAAMAECYYMAVAPHNPLGPISLAAALQLDACIPNFLIQEQVTLGEGYLKEPFRMVDGCIAISEKPGLGIELDDEKVNALRYPGDWETPRVWDRQDGSVADW
ncbi:galactonate dehydratase [Hydrogenispora ethanolica]|jgi:galactonate dehydratase|uniref:Galactonate dehydratase n=1 Tax=Hydrogenispora ethanolica TaxID=1082276 RepID=A0A4R1SA94_HYDET|nr:galactonate dehydratase [Hydrogenispora ethanolica]TCL76269.1 galactonate dehydratase [Hydrogenispora ethanolica]